MTSEEKGTEQEHLKRAIHDSIRNEITKLVTQYCDALDNKDFTALETIFTRECEVFYDYKLFGFPIGNRGHISSIIEWLKPIKRSHSYTNHMISNIYFDLSSLEQVSEKRVNVSAKLVCYQKTKYIPLSYVSVAIFHFEILESKENWLIDKLVEKQGLLSPVLTFENIVFALAFYSCSWLIRI